MIITIDGTSGSGKSTVAALIAKKFGYEKLDSGALYRSMAHKILIEGADPADPEAVQKVLDGVKLHVENEPRGARYIVDGQDVTDQIRSPEVSQVASKVAGYPFVRALVLNMQRHYPYKKGLVAEGRDMGSVVFPGATRKLFLSAKPEERAKRRYQELIERSVDGAATVSFDEVLNGIVERDRRDEERENCPLVRPEGAIEIDTTNLSIEEVCVRMENAIAKPKRKKFWGYILGERFSEINFVYGFCYVLTKGIYKLFYRSEIYGRENLVPGKGIVAVNHVSFLDPPLMGSSIPDEVYAMAIDYLFKFPPFAWLLRKLHSIPVSGNASDRASLKRTLDVLSKDKKLLIFPEGERRKCGTLGPLKGGVAMLASLAKADVYPTYLYGTYQAFPPGKKFPKFWGKVYVVFGKPLKWADYEHLSAKEARVKLLEDLAVALRDLEQNLFKQKNISPN
ncbi:MAG: Cytidylate kinase [Chlamydiia bacterium]|nr:Cytidylate kinase [Chlamydiia bacterium]